jgi:alcohol dehydrogenase
VADLATHYGRRALIFTGGGSFRRSGRLEQFAADLAARGIESQYATVAGEPSPESVDGMAAQFREFNPACVVGIGGGSVLDAAKAVAGLLRIPNSVIDFLEGVGPELPYPGSAVPFIAVPTTAGTGSEATKNAVLSRRGADGFKKSFRDERLVAEYALLDPDLLSGCPPELIAGNGMDALTQLLESYVSLRANPFTDALCISGLTNVREGLLAWYRRGSDAKEEMARMGFAALLSGITLAQCGLGSVHGIAAPLGAFFPVPHGIACGTLVAAATEVNVIAMREREPQNPALRRYAEVGFLLANRLAGETDAGIDLLLGILHNWTEELQLPPLSAYGVREEDTGGIALNSRGSSMKTNPIPLSDEEIEKIIRKRVH